MEDARRLEFAVSASGDGPTNLGTAPSSRASTVAGQQRPLVSQTNNMARGKLIVFEGLDRAGKSTQCQMLVDDLQNDGIKVRHMRFPGTCTYSEAIRWRANAHLVG